MLGLVADPCPPNSTEMRDGSGRRLRVGDYRVIYRVEADELTIHAVGHRKDVYDPLTSAHCDRYRRTSNEWVGSQLPSTSTAREALQVWWGAV